ncbi:MAG: polymer-forming cytoskeletal protein [Candidatus Rokubacteria bacterium]|nr:polymer-forming cytoskeletal protein [Candidatus Rokubacteria bacterium]
MFGERKSTQKPVSPVSPDNGKPGTSITLLTVVGDHARMEGKFGGKLVIGEKGVVNANVQTVDAIIMGHYEGNMVATGNVEITETGRVSGNIQTDSLVISKGGFFNGNVTKMHETAARQVVPIEEKRAGHQIGQR